MKTKLMYIELKTGYSDDGPAWIGKVMFSKTGKTLYFNDKAFYKYGGYRGYYSDIESGEKYWISGIKKNGEDRHWAGRGKVFIDRNCVDEYLDLIGQSTINLKYLIPIEIKEQYPVDRINALNNFITEKK